MKIMKIVSYIICGLGLAGGLMLMGEGDGDGMIAIAVYSFFLAFTYNVKA